MLCRPVPSNLPRSLAAGDTWAWTDRFTDVVPGAGTSMVYTVRARLGTGFLQITGTASSDGLSFDFLAAATDTAKLTPGPHTVSRQLTVGTVKTSFNVGALKVTPNYADPNAEQRTPNEIALAEAEAALAAIRNNPNSSYTTSSGTFTKQDMSKLREEVDRLKRAVQQERGQSGAVTIRTAFGRQLFRL